MQIKVCLRENKSNIVCRTAHHWIKLACVQLEALVWLLIHRAFCSEMCVFYAMSRDVSNERLYFIYIFRPYTIVVVTVADVVVVVNASGILLLCYSVLIFVFGDILIYKFFFVFFCFCFFFFCS